MTEKFLQLPATERRAILLDSSLRLNRHPVIIEKDIWVCCVLSALFSMRNPHPMAFKGGTSLSKVFSLINRFSEDIDITLDYRAFTEEIDPTLSNISKSAIKRLNNTLKKTYILILKMYYNLT